MAGKDLRKMKRIELLDTMIEQGKRLEEQTERANKFEERTQKLELQVQASEDRIGHLKEQLGRASRVNDDLRSKIETAERQNAKMKQELRTLRKENVVLTTKLDDVSRQLKQLSGFQLPGLGSSDKEALSVLAQRMESALEKSQEADIERTARLEAILENQQEMIDDLTARNAPISEDAIAPFIPIAVESSKPRGFRLGQLNLPWRRKKKDE